MNGRSSIKNFIDVGDAGAPIGSQPWCRASHVELCALKRRTDHEVRSLKYLLLEFKQQQRWQQLYDNDGSPFGSWDDYVQYPEPNGLGMSADIANAVLKEKNDAKLVRDVLGQHGGDRRSLRAKEHQVANSHLKTSDLSSTSVARTLARLRRKHPNLAKRVERGELSANAAAELAGFRKKRTPLQTVLKLLPKLTDDEWRQVLRARQELS